MPTTHAALRIIPTRAGATLVTPSDNPLLTISPASAEGRARFDDLLLQIAAAPAILASAQRLLRDWDMPDPDDTAPIAERFGALRAAVALAQQAG